MESDHKYQAAHPLSMARRVATEGASIRPAQQSPPTNYFGGVGVQPGATIVPQRGQCAQPTSIGDWQKLQVREAVEVTVAERAGVELVLPSSGSAAIPFLNSFVDFPSDFARSGSLVPPKNTQSRGEAAALGSPDRT